MHSCFIGVDTEGLVAATAVGFVRKVPILYWSLEIRSLRDCTDLIRRFFKRIEKRCHRRALLTIIQDRERADSLMQENRIRAARVIIVPNGPLGPPPRLSSSYLHAKFGLKPAQLIILNIGMICPEVLSLELAGAAARWPEQWSLIFHERAIREPSDPYLRQILDAGGERVLLTLRRAGSPGFIRTYRARLLRP
jgi:hypothetical protein